jgi:UDP-hydrolysing UDP-N-acetyl-D-glucosamine 2-epimerase
MRTVAAVTVSRSDYWIYRPVLRAIEREPRLRLRVIAAGTHLSRRHGMTARAIVRDGFRVHARVPTMPKGDEPSGIARAMGRAVEGFAVALERMRPDLLLVLGDRWEMHAAALAALPLLVPVAHIHGGELTEGAFDDCLRHSVTKLSHLHFPATARAARRIVQLGEDPRRVQVVGAPALDALLHERPLPRAEWARRLGLPATEKPLLVTFHPVTTEYARAETQAGELLAAVAGFGLPVLITMPNTDTRSSRVRLLIRRFADGRPSVRVVENLGDLYPSALAHSAAMVGNSSSGIIEAPSFGLPVINVGNRQGGRERGTNVIDAPPERAAIAAALRRALSPSFRRRISARRNPYGDGRAARRIAARLAETDLSRLIPKRFHDLGGRRG